MNIFHEKAKGIVLCLVFLLNPGMVYLQNAVYSVYDSDILPYGNTFKSWEQKPLTGRELHVDQGNVNGRDDGTGKINEPFKTISAAAKFAVPGDRILIHGGVYRESIHPARGGDGPSRLISYERYGDEEVIIKGSIVLEKNRFETGKGWIYKSHEAYTNEDIQDTFKVWMYTFSGKEFSGYNPFGMMNILHDREYLQYQKVNMDSHFKRRGMVFVNGKPLEQVLRPVDFQDKPEGAFWVEHNGMRIHIRYPEGLNPENTETEACVKEQLFVPVNYGTGYIRLKGLCFMHAANGFPVPQRGMVSSNRGHHWIIEECRMEWANSLGIDLGNEMWHTVNEPGLGYHIFRRNIIRNCGIAGLEALTAPSLLVEDNLFENIGWQNAEHAWESGAIKLHKAENCLIRRNVFRNIKSAPGIWLDYLSNKNCRITHNLFTDITTARGAIYVEVSRNLCMIDHNIIHKLRSQYWISGEYGAGGSGLYTDGSDSIIFENNLLIDIENTGYGSYLNAERIVGMRGGITRFHKVIGNVFIDCRKHAIEFPNEDNFSNRNLFSGISPGYLKMGNPQPALLLDLEAWRTLYGWEKDGTLCRLKASFNSEKLVLNLECLSPSIERLPPAGPFGRISELKDYQADPRKL